MADWLNLTTVIEIIFIPQIVAAFFLYTKGQIKPTTDDEQLRTFGVFQRVYFFPYFLALLSDWLQGPYVYELYNYYGFPHDQIAILYVVGFAASGIFGTVAGPMADKFGRKMMTILFYVMYSLCCLSKLFSNFYVLIMGRVLGGVATSILFSVFESWYIHEHLVVKKYPIDWISYTFSTATFANGILAIIAGVTAQATSEWMELGPVSPFIVAVPFMIAGAILVATTWTENYGEIELHWCNSYVEGLKTIFCQKQILLLGLVQSIFEANMYIFVFMWTPVLEPGQPPLGLTFASFMVMVMIGSALYSVLLRNNVNPATILKLCLVISGISFFVCAATSTIEFQKELVYVSFVSFLLLELSIGMYLPCIGRLRGEIIPDTLRANIMNWFRLPMNIITCGILVGMHVAQDNKHANEYVFIFCATTSIFGYVLSSVFSKVMSKISSTNDANVSNAT